MELLETQRVRVLQTRKRPDTIISAYALAAANMYMISMAILIEHRIGKSITFNPFVNIHTRKGIQNNDLTQV